MQLRDYCAFLAQVIVLYVVAASTLVNYINANLSHACPNWARLTLCF